MMPSPRVRFCAVPIALGAFLASPGTLAQQILLNGAPVAGSPMVVGQVAVPADGVLSLGPGTSITDGGHAVIDLADGTTITVNNLGTITSTGGIAINANGSTLSVSNGGAIAGDFWGVAATTITSLENSGTITANTFDGVIASTIESLVNSGTITGNDFGVLATTQLTSLVNSGTIVGDGFDGVLGGTITGLVNSGTIVGFDAGVRAVAVTSLTNSGTIVGGGANAIRETGAADTLLTLLAGSNIQGLVDLGGGTNTLNVGNGLSMATTFVGAAPVIGSTSGAPFAVSGTTVHVADPTGFALADGQLADLTGGISDVLAGRFASAPDGAVAVAMANGTQLTVTPASGSGEASRAWAEVFGGWKDRSADGPSVGSDHVFGGVMAGIDTTVGEGSRAGFFLGGSQARADVDFDAQEIETESVFAGLYASHDTGSVRIDGAVTVGLADYDSKRMVANNLVAGGLETARADYEGVFVSPEITVSTAMAMGPATVRPSLRLRYAGLWLDDYAETGSASNLTVDDRSVHILEARAQVAVPMTVMEDERRRLTTELRLGVDARTSLGPDRVDAVLVGQTISFDPGGDDDVVTGFAAAAFAMALAGGVSLTGSIEAGYGTDETAHATARLGARVDF